MTLKEEKLSPRVTARPTIRPSSTGSARRPCAGACVRAGVAECEEEGIGAVGNGTYRNEYAKVCRGREGEGYTRKRVREDAGARV